jgi:SagB-type dehydrogenase family enzyme
MLRPVLVGIFFLALVLLAGCVADTPAGFQEGDPGIAPMTEIPLPDPVKTGRASVEEALQMRRSVRSYSRDPITLQELSQLLWAAQGITDPAGYRTAPSAGALYPLELTVAVARVEDLDPGIYRYRPPDHTLNRLATGNVTDALFRAALSQSAVRDAAAVIVISAVPARTTGKYGQRGMRYVYMEAGHAGQNIYLQAESLNIGTVSIGAFDDGEVGRIMNLEKGEIPLSLMPVGKP